MILVDDGSDNILSKFIEINDYDFKLKIIRSNFNKGQSASIKIAPENVEDSSNLIGLIDGDGQKSTNRELAKNSIKNFWKECDAVVSYRNNEKDSLSKKCF